MKKFLMYCLVLVVMLFLGFTTYYFVANKENIVFAFDETQTLKLNVGESFSFDDVITHTQPHSGTSFSVQITDTNILTYNDETKIFSAESAGGTVLTIKPSNTRFGPFIINVKVGNGLTTEYPIYISDSNELARIGTSGSVWTSNLNYELIANIYLLNKDWQPLSSFNGTFNGAGHTICNLTITNSHTSGNAGLFAEIGTNGVVKYTAFSEANIKGTFSNVGIVAGVNKGTICLIDIQNSTIENQNGNTGAVVGANDVSVLTSSNRGATVGMCGVQTTSITSGGGSAGGIVGKNNGGIVDNCFSVLSKFKGSATFGGIVGQNLLSILNGSNLFSSIKYCHAGVNTVLGTNVSGIAGTSNDGTSGFKNIYTRNYFTINTNNYVGSKGASDFAVENIAKKSLTEMQSKSTYIDWNFTTTWLMADSYAVLNYANGYSLVVNENDIEDIIDGIIVDSGDNNLGEIVNSSNEIYDMVCEMRANPDSGKSYVVNGTFVENLTTGVWLNETWVPIGTSARPFTCKFMVQSGSSLTFANLNVGNYDYAGFFGYIGSGAIISGITFQNTTITSTGADGFAGVIAGRLGTNSSIVNCKVSGFEINGKGSIGGIAGINYGTIQGTTIDAIRDNTISVNSASVNAGAITGTNEGTIYNTTASGVEINYGNSASGSAGGIAGINNGSIISSSSSSADININSTGLMRVGGIAGQNNKIINASTVANSNITLPTQSGNSYVGGIAGINATSGAISSSKTTSTNLTGYYAGGITVDNFGTISKCMVGNETQNLGIVSGVYVGGLAVINKPDATISNSGVYDSLVGLDDFGCVSGFAYSLKENSVIENCFSSAVFGGIGGFNCDTDTPYRNWLSNIAQFLPWNDKMGTITNSLIVNTSDKYVQGYGVLIDLFDNPILTKYDNIISQEIAKGSDNFMIFTEKNFSISNWSFSSGRLPTPII